MWRVLFVVLVGAIVPPVVWAKPAQKSPVIGDERVLLRTNRGDLVVGLYDDVAPRHAAQIRKLVRLGVYDSCTIFRVEPGYLAQLTDAPNRKEPLTSEQRKAITRIPAELSKLRHRPGVVSMAHDDNDINSAKTSFSFMLGRAPDLDGKYTIIGELEWGQAMLAQIAREPREWNNRPRSPVIVERAEIKTGEQIAQMRTAGQIRGTQPLSPPRP
jgi:cyclophilin family peptidyl-prolyl cis-trans isomerase